GRAQSHVVASRRVPPSSGELASAPRRTSRRSTHSKNSTGAPRAPKKTRLMTPGWVASAARKFVIGPTSQPLAAGGAAPPGELDELVGDHALAHDERHAALAVGQLEDEALHRGAPLGARQRLVDDVAVARDRARHELERVARARTAERRAHSDLAPLAGAVGIEQREAAFEDLEGLRHATGRARPVILHQVVEGERQRSSPVEYVER